MTNNRKKLTGLLTITLLLFVGIAGTFAYLTAKTEPKTNTFTVGKVAITLAEPKWDAEGADHKIVPGAVLEKDPTITVAAKSVASYIFLEVTPSADFTSLGDLYTINYNNLNWTKLTNTGSRIVYYYTTNVAEENVPQILAPLFTEVSFNSALTASQLKELTTATIGLKGYAIQTSGVDTVAEAWAEVSN